MSHRAVIEAGPTAIRRLCCGAAEATDAAAALEWIDDPVALVDGQPVALPELLRSVLACPEPAESVEIIHPSWWSVRRVQLFTAAAAGLAGDVVIRTRAALLSNAFQGASVVEIGARLVSVTGRSGAGAPEITAEPRVGSPETVADSVARRLVADHPAAVVIDAPGEAAALAVLIAEKVRGAAQVTVVDGLPVTAAPDIPTPGTAAPVVEPSRTRGRLRIVATAAALAVVTVGLRAHPNVPPEAPIPATYLIEGRVAVQVPTGWPVRRATGGPGSERVEVASPTDPQLVLHLTQAPASGDTLTSTAEALQRALEQAEAQTPGVFVDFDPADSSAGRPAVTYREMRGGHQVDWTVLVDGAVRIGIGCQSGPGGREVLRPVCEQAVRSARVLR